MQPQRCQTLVDVRSAEAEVIASAYRRAHHGDECAALLAAIADAPADLDAPDRRVLALARQISNGYARATVAGR